jgi:hypothetical protein
MKKLFLISALSLSLASCSTSVATEEAPKTDSTACCVKGDTTLVDSVNVDTVNADTASVK